jgi:two-component system KDP operon response regulator KdpE
MSEARLLVVEDDPQMQRLLESQLKTRGFDAHVVATGNDAIMAAADENPDLILLDIGLPDMDGLEVCKRIRDWSPVPIILVTAADVPQTKINALEYGADDYLTKPFHTGELVARIRAVLRRASATTHAHDAVVEVDGLKIDLAERQVWRDGDEVKLTRLEFDLLKELVRNADKVLTHTHLLDSVWGPGNDDVRFVHVHVCNLRRKLERGVTGKRRILAVQGIGYRFRMRDS